MKALRTTIAAGMLLVAVVGLTGCGNDKTVTAVKALAFSYPDNNVQDPNMTTGQVLDHRKLCDSVKWSVNRTDRGQAYVEYDCNYKGIGDSAIIERDKSDVASAGDVYQWTYGADEQPALSYVSFIIRYKDGTSKDFTPNVTRVMKMAADDQVENFDQAFSSLTGAAIPVKPASPITDTTYGNALTPLFPGHSPTEAAVLAYRWTNAPVSVHGIGKLGYPIIDTLDSSDSGWFSGIAYAAVRQSGSASPEAGIAKLAGQLFSVDPADVQFAMKIDPGKLAAHPAVLYQLSPNKFACLDRLCFDSDGLVVGRAPASILAKETVASASDDSDWPGSNSCMQSWVDDYHVERQKERLGDTVTLDQAKKWAGWCHTGFASPNVQKTNVGDRIADPMMPVAGKEQLISDLTGLDVDGWSDETGYPVYSNVTCGQNGSSCKSVKGSTYPSIQYFIAHMYPVEQFDINASKISCNQWTCVDDQKRLIGRAPNLDLRQLK